MSSFNPYQQNITITTSDGTPFNITMTDLDGYVQEGITTCVDYGAQLGASVVTFVMLLLLTRPQKRRSAVFGLNLAALCLNIARLVCEILFFTGAFFETYAYFSGDYARVKPSNYASSILAMVFLALLEICIQCSLILQTLAICANLPTLQKHLFLGFSTVVVAVTTGFRLAEMALNAKCTITDLPFTQFIWLEKANTILMAISICFFSTIFMYKLAFSIYRRRQLGIRQFGPMQALFIMSCQTMIVPAIFAILQFASDVPEINSNIFTFVVISLPVTSLWASATLPGHSKSSLDSESGKPLWNMLSSSSSSGSSETLSRSHHHSLGSTASPPRAGYQDLERGKYTVGIRRDSLLQ
ncbi:Pheromone P-factor receptor [Talaromyces islandicus]|uniref:Pheromone P-factor receptor n=1 Tax=Talaromyces islandicus TaxID=28573 RepID=A0A0U1LRR7_TALIS|nr:Pheromone P-factor receptor [Talaromyces islandicus]